jgi:hypothetical protein
MKNSMAIRRGLGQPVVPMGVVMMAAPNPLLQMQQQAVYNQQPVYSQQAVIMPQQVVMMPVQTGYPPQQGMMAQPIQYVQQPKY